MVSEYLENVLSYIEQIRKTDIRGRTVEEWLILFFQLSFILWGAILAWTGYNFYQDYTKLKTEENRKSLILQRKKHEIIYLKRKIKNIELAYKVLKKHFDPKQIAILKKAIDRKWREQQRLITDWQNYAVENYVFPKEYKPKLEEELTAYKFSLQGISISDKTVKKFNNIYKKLLTTQKTVKGDINVTRLGGYYVLYFDPGHGDAVTLKDFKYIGFVRNIFATTIPITGAVFKKYQIEEKDYSKPFLVGWKLDLTKGGL